MSLQFLVSAGLMFVAFGQSFTYPGMDVDFRYTLPVDTCIQNVSHNGNSDTPRYSGGQGGSMMCRCNEESIPTQSSVMCSFYDNEDCTGNLDFQNIWGGCVDDKYLYYVESCDRAREVAATDGCQYYVSQRVSQADLNQVVAPLYQCMDYNCNGNNNSPESRSCQYRCTTDGNTPTVQESLYENYNCTGSADQFNTEDYSERVCDSTSGAACGVRVTKYDIVSFDYNCGSKKSPFKTSSSTGNKKYFMEGNSQVPIPIGACFETRNGFYSYSYKYECEEDDVGISTVMKKVYLGSTKCKGDYYNSENVTSVNNTVSCSGSSGKGSYGLYAACSNNNWDAYYQDYPMLFGQCVPYMLDPDVRDNFDEGLVADRAWNQNLRVVFSCNLKKRYLSAYFYVDEDCEGDYLFYWDWNGYYSNYNSYGTRRCARPAIQNCGNSKDSATNKIGQQLY